MMACSQKKKVWTTVIASVVLILAIVLISIGIKSVAVKVILALIFLAAYGVAIYFLWGKAYFAAQAQQAAPAEAPKSAPKPVQEAPEGEEVANRTGSICEVTGTYYCTEHSFRTVEMTEGKRFPPCRGDGTGHSATWTMEKPE